MTLQFFAYRVISPSGLSKCYTNRGVKGGQTDKSRNRKANWQPSHQTMPATGEFDVGVVQKASNEEILSSSGSDSGGHSEDEELALRRDYTNSVPRIGAPAAVATQLSTSHQRSSGHKQTAGVKSGAVNMDDRCLSQLSRDKHEPFLKQCLDELLENALFKGIAKDQKVLNWTNPEDLSKIFDMSLFKDPQSDEQLLEAIRKTIKYSVKTGHPYFVNQLFSTVDPYGLIGQWTTDALNPSVYTYEVSPVFTLMEETVLREMRKIVGFSVDGEGDGIFVPGGSMANGYAISCARFKAMPDVKVNIFSVDRREINWSMCVCVPNQSLIWQTSGQC